MTSRFWRIHPGGELDSVRLNEQGTMAALLWNFKGKNALSLYDLAKNVHTNVQGCRESWLAGSLSPKTDLS